MMVSIKKSVVRYKTYGLSGERYFVVAASFYMFVPTVFSIILFIGVLHVSNLKKNRKIFIL